MARNSYRVDYHLIYVIYFSEEVPSGSERPQLTADDRIRPRSSLRATSWSCQKTKSYQRLESFLHQHLKTAAAHESCTA
jgi:hypothetical protein